MKKLRRQWYKIVSKIKIKYKYTYYKCQKNPNIIQDFRAYTLRKNRWSPELESKAKSILAKSKNRSEAQRLLQREGFKPDEAERVIFRFYKTQRRKSFTRSDKLSPGNSPIKKIQAPLSPRDQHVDLIGFSQNVRRIIFVLGHFNQYILSLSIRFICWTRTYIKICVETNMVWVWMRLEICRPVTKGHPAFRSYQVYLHINRNREAVRILNRSKKKCKGKLNLRYQWHSV